jgi:hypothetical protein
MACHRPDTPDARGLHRPSTRSMSRQDVSNPHRRILTGPRDRSIIAGSQVCRVVALCLSLIQSRTATCGAVIRRNRAFLQQAAVRLANIPQRSLLHLWQNMVRPAVVFDSRRRTTHIVRGLPIVARCRKPEKDVMKIVKREADLLEIVSTMHSAGCRAGLLNGRQQQSNQNCDDCNDD